MATPPSSPTIAARHGEIPASLLNVCFVLLVINATFFPAAYLAHWWIYNSNGAGIPTDFVNVWAAGRLALEGHPAQAWDWMIQKQVELALLKQDFIGYFAWHYPPPFLFVASLLARFPYAVAFIGWVAISFLPYLAVMRAIVGRPFGLVLAAAFPVVFNNALVGQNGFLTAALIGGTLYLIPVRPVLAGICLGLLSYKPQYGLLFPLVLIAAGAVDGVFYGGCRCDCHGCDVVVRLRYRKLAGVLPLDAGFFAGLPYRGQGSLVEDAKPVRADPVFRRRRAARLDMSLDPERRCCGGAGGDVAQPGQLFVEGRRAGDRYAARYPVSVHV